MKTYIRTFVNPILALAFKDGVDFVNDPDVQALTPKKEGENKWIVEINTDDEEDDDVIYTTATEVKEEDKPATSEPISPSKLTLKDYEAKFSGMHPRQIGVSRIEDDNTSEEGFSYIPPITEPCGSCLSCKMGGDCIEVINAAIEAMHGAER